VFELVLAVCAVLSTMWIMYAVFLFSRFVRAFEEKKFCNDVITVETRPAREMGR